MLLKSASLAVACVFALLGSAWAHHSHANYENTEVIQVTGTVIDHQWVNPHTWIYVSVVGENGEPQMSALESGSTGQLIRQGWNADSIEPGDEITAHVKPPKHGTNGGLLGVVILPDGASICNPEFMCP